MTRHSSIVTVGILATAGIGGFAGLAGVAGAAGLAGCGPGPAIASRPTPQLHCPDPLNCTRTNGSGVYFAEDGLAGIGTVEKLMITHFFIGDDARVRFHARYFDPLVSAWRGLIAPGEVLSATYEDQANLGVLSVTEDGTVPTWTLRNEAGRPVHVTGEALASLRLNLRFRLMNEAERLFEIDFAGEVIPRPANRNDKRAHSEFAMRWRPLGSQEPAVPYCQDASGAADQAVFQRGIDVDPLDGRVTRNAAAATMVTLSCARGAMATVYRWGYDYLATPALSTYYFDAGIHMKRASYCADTAFYTVAGTELFIADDRHINADQIQALEARWSPDGALCVNLANLRHPEKGFTGSCNGQPLRACTTVALKNPPPPSLVEGRATGRR